MPSIFERIRRILVDDKGVNDEEWITADEAMVNDIVGYFDHITDITQVKTAIVQRYGTGIRQDKDDAGNTFETYTHEEVAALVDAGMWEAVTIGYGDKVVSSLATLFSEKGSRFTLKKETEDQDLKGLEDILERNRRQGGAKTALVKSDERAQQCASSLVFLEWRDDHILYRSLDPGRIQACFNSTIVDAGENRPTDKMDIEDATKIVIKTGETDQGIKSYIAIYGRCIDYPNGRYVVYQDSSDGRKVPAVGSDNAYDHLIDGEVVNPMSLWAAQHPDESWPEYPLCILKNGSGEDSLLPVSDSLYRQSLNYDVAASHTLSTSQNAAAGTLTITRDNQARAMPLPRSLYGAVDLPPGMTMERIAGDAGAGTAAYDVLKSEQVDSAAARGVPDYMVASEDHTLDASSGVALAVKTRPLRMMRQKLADLNKPAIRKMFKLETAFICLFGEEQDSDKALLQTISQEWETGSVALPENKKEKSERIIALKKDGIHDEIAAIQDWYDYDTIEEAIEEYERIKARKSKYPPLVEPEQNNAGAFGKPVGIARRKSNAGQQQR